jgi:hypothetical protein
MQLLKGHFTASFHSVRCWIMLCTAGCNKRFAAPTLGRGFPLRARRISLSAQHNQLQRDAYFKRGRRQNGRAPAFNQKSDLLTKEAGESTPPALLSLVPLSLTLSELPGGSGAADTSPKCIFLWIPKPEAPRLRGSDMRFGPLA